MIDLCQETLPAPRFTISADHYLDDGDAKCPFCSNPMSKTEPDHPGESALYICIEETCPFTVNEDMQAVYRGLCTDLEMDHLAAAQLAAQYVPGDFDDAEPRFTVDSIDKADWVLAKMADSIKREADIQALIDAEHKRIDQRAEAILTPLINRRRFFEAAFGPQLQEWTRQYLAGGKERSVKMLHGSTGFRKMPDKVIVADEARAIEIAERNGWTGMVRVKKEISKTAAKEALRDEIVADILGDAVHIEPGGDKFEIKPEAI